MAHILRREKAYLKHLFCNSGDNFQIRFFYYLFFYFTGTNFARFISGCSSRISPR